MATILSAAGAAGNWTSGGAWVGGVAPTAADDAVLQATTTSMTIDSGAVCRSLVDTAFTGTLTHTAGVTLTIGDATAGAGSVALNFGSFTYTLGDAATSAISFISTSATVQTVNFNGKTTGNVTFNATSNGSWQYTGGHVQTSSSGATVTLTKGTLDINGQTVTWDKFDSSVGNTRTLTLGAANITITNAAGAANWNILTTSLTFNANTSTITISGANSNFIAGGQTYNNVVFTGVSQPVLSASGASFANLTRTGAANQTSSLSLTANLTVTGTLTLTGNSITNRALLVSNVVGSQRTVTAAVVSINNCDFRDIKGAGGASPFTGTSLGDAGGNATITTDTPVTRYWVGNGGNWSDTAHWSTSDGGSTGASVPLVHDTNVFTSNSITSASQTITKDIARSADIDFSNVLNSPVFSNGVTTPWGAVHGSLTFKSGMTTTGTNTLTFYGRSNASLTTNTVTISFPVTINTPSAIVFSLGSNYSSTGVTTGIITLQINATFTTNGFNITNAGFTWTGNSSILNLGATTWTCQNSSGTPWNVSAVTPATLTLNAGTSTIIISDTGATAKTFAGGGLTTYNNVTFSGDNITVTGSNTFNNLGVNTAALTNGLKLTSGTTTTVSSFSTNGSSGSLAKLVSTTGGSAATLSKSSGTVDTDYLSLKDSAATGGATWYAGAGSTDVSGNSGWIFTNAPLSSTAFMTPNTGFWG